MFQPTMDFDNVGVTALDQDHIFLYMINGSGENRYTLSGPSKRRVISQIIYKILNNSSLFLLPKSFTLIHHRNWFCLTAD
jgi:hypothetical protein